MTKEGIHPSILKAFPTLSEEKKEAIASMNGPQLIIAGPGSGKTYTLVLRTLNILLNGLAKPDEIILCTFTEKSAFELRDRISLYAKKVGYSENIQDMIINTIHGLSNAFLMKNRHYTHLGSNYDTLDELTQKLFIYDNFEEIISKKGKKPYLNKWNTEWTAIDGIIKYFDKITEELIDVSTLKKSKDPFVVSLAHAYSNYEKCLADKNKIDFAHLQKYFYVLLNTPKIGPEIISKIKYVMVDEYQDTNFIQEQILLKLTSITNDLCVVGDEDQSLYRFRGATVRNILEFQNNFKNCKYFKLVTNYRSHKNIIEAYNKFIKSWDWSSDNPKVNFRHDKHIVPDPETKFKEYPAVMSIIESSGATETEKFAEFIKFLKTNNIIKDYNQVALLMYSVRAEHSAPYIDALKKIGIPAFCPRRRAFFENEEIKLMIACLSLILEYTEDKRGDVTGRTMPEIVNEIDIQIEKIKNDYSNDSPLWTELKKAMTEVDSIKSKGTLDKRLADFLYQLISVDPFKKWLDDENKARNLAMLSQMLTIFQNYYHYTVITYKNLKWLKLKFFNSFLKLLYEGGVNDFEDPNTPFPKGYVQIMTIHQSKGMEFPVVFVNSLSSHQGSQKEVNKVLSSFYAKPVFEPEDRITGFDRMRLYYVAFSRAEKILVLTSSEEPNGYFEPILHGLEHWPHDKKELLKALSFEPKERDELKQGFSFTSDLNVYETCPRQYKFFNEFEFSPSRSAEMFFGSLVHHTIEEIHRTSLSGNIDKLNAEKVRDFFELNFKQLLSSGMRPLAERQKELAFTQVLNYYTQNKKEMSYLKEIEVDVSLEKDRYILNGKIDLVVGKDKKIEILDFKSQKRPEKDKELIDNYRKQLCIYGHILERRYGKTPDKLVIYWTGEKNKKDARMEFSYDPKIVSSAVKEFDKVVDKILNKDYTIKKVPEEKYCRECDIKKYCVNMGTIKIKEPIVKRLLKKVYK